MTIEDRLKREAELLNRMGLDPSTEYLTTPEVAKHFRWTTQTIRTRINDGDFPGAFRRGRTWLVPLSSVVDFIERSYGPQGSTP